LVPLGKKIRFDESVSEKLNSVNVKVKRSHRNGRVVDIDFDNDRSNRYRSGIDYIMGIDGRLKDERGDEVEVINNSGNDYRYNQSDSEIKRSEQDAIQKRIEIEKQKKEESERIIKDLEEKQKAEQKKTTVFKKESNGSKEESSFVSGPSPVSAMAEWF
jgi:hypothetical protein